MSEEWGTHPDHDAEVERISLSFATPKEVSLTQFQILMKAARSNLYDDAPWLALYDWLEETGGDLENAKFIRRDCLRQRLGTIQMEKAGRRIAYKIECLALDIPVDEENENYGKHLTEEEKEIVRILGVSRKG